MDSADIARLHRGYASLGVILGGILLAIGPFCPWLVTNTVARGSRRLVSFSGHGPWAGTIPVSVDALHLGRLVGSDTTWMHVAGVVYLCLGVSAIASGLWQLSQRTPPKRVEFTLFVALAVVGALDVLLTKRDIHVEFSSHGLYVYSVGFGYTLCAIGGPLAFVSSLWLRRFHRH